MRNARQRTRVAGYVTCGAVLGVVVACSLDDPQLQKPDGGGDTGGAAASGGDGSTGGRTGTGATTASSGGAASGGTNSGGKPASGGTPTDLDGSADGWTEGGSAGGAGAGGAGAGGEGSCASDPCGPGTCTPQAAGHVCTCDKGYVAASGTCRNVDECTEALDDCHPSSICRDTDGSFTCECPPGFSGGERGVSCRPRVAAGSAHFCALMPDATVRCWGDNSSGQLGDGTTAARTAPTPVSGLANVAVIEAGRDNTCAILKDGTARCWGANDRGQVGDNSQAEGRTWTRERRGRLSHAGQREHGPPRRQGHHLDAREWYVDDTGVRRRPGPVLRGSGLRRSGDGAHFRNLAAYSPYPCASSSATGMKRRDAELMQ